MTTVPKLVREACAHARENRGLVAFGRVSRDLSRGAWEGLALDLFVQTAGGYELTLRGQDVADDEIQSQKARK